MHHVTDNFNDHLRQLTQNIDKITNDLIAKSNSSKSGYIDISTIIRNLNITIKNEQLDKDKSGAILIKADGSCIIYVNEKTPVVRQRFTLAHELGHYISYKYQQKMNCIRIDYLNNSYEATDNALDSNDIIWEKDRGILAENGTDAEEVFANKFAARILMPTNQLKQSIETIGYNVELLAEKFWISKEAMQIRLINME